MTRVGLLSLLLVFLSSCTAVDPGSADNGNSELSWRILASGGSSRAASGENPGSEEVPRLVIARSQQEYGLLWTRYIGEETRPPAAFDEETVVFLLGAVRPTGGYEIDPRAVEMEGDRLIINAEIDGPPPGSMVTQAITAPWAVVAVNRREFVEAQWFHDGALVARNTPAAPDR